MKLSVRANGLAFINMCVYLCRGDIGVSEHLLNCAYIRAVGQQVACETVSQHVRRKTHAEASGLRTFHQHCEDALPRKWRAPLRQEKAPFLISTPREHGAGLRHISL